MPDLFHTPDDYPLTILETDGVCRYFGNILPEKSSSFYFDHLLHQISWKNDEVIVFGKRYVTSRKTAWYGNSGLSYTYAGIEHQPLAWTKQLLDLRSIVESATNAKFNSCLLNLYHNGTEGMGWHRDNEKEIVKNSTIASLSLGAERIFKLKHITTNQIKEVTLQNGSLLTMEGAIQQNWLHCLPKSSKIKHPRINLTFRLMSEGYKD